ncbi:precorrin-2 dehydrogenase [Candidatus Koribacter versatilis Ellin345]|uniref:precorrin-2 dehydrogenase n=1 Tax=Koribacter versatilis (strain Ellin345) TaxID=204669 RepID=Q1IP25_KORVE|nr:bifunctional precorrin-2 dehydrogenase/sirohydrochlorin ferrochelatase [Candidatus Koribacter versatilis]ABF41375.1 precorrin-2 dehydrogenase [Candidatus Koribacter versatilis Ellin345]
MVLFPAFLKLQGRPLLIVGGGAIAEQKLDGMIEAEALITLVAPQITPAIREIARAGSIQWIAREFRRSDLNRTFLVIAATGNPRVNEEIFREADRRNILCNAVDEPERCHFYYGSVVRRGDLQIAISTNGKSPALAQRLRKEFETLIDGTYAEWLEWLGRVRTLYINRRVQREQRVRALHHLASRPVFERYRQREVSHHG